MTLTEISLILVSERSTILMFLWIFWVYYSTSFSTVIWSTL